jgi:uncharacterized membrane protein
MIKISPAEKRVFVLIAFVACLILARIIYSGSFCYLFLLWNIFLAFVPLKVSMQLKKESALQFRSTTLLICWLLFFPNSLYLITDLIHLEQRQNVPVWYDAVLLYVCASVGLIIAFISLYEVELFLTGKMKNNIKNTVIVFCLFLGSFGVYLGRFLRWNSWDVIFNPVRITKGIAARVFLPFDYLRTWAVTLLFTCLFNLLYSSLKRLPFYLNKETT